MALTATEVSGAKTSDDGKPYKLFDQGGLYLHVTGTGSKLWRYQFRLNGRQSIASLGKYPVMSLKDAREAHLAAQKLVAQGINPTSDRKARVEAEKAARVESFASVAKMWLAFWRVGKSERHVSVTESRLNGKIIPALGGYSLNAITAKIVREFAQRVEAESGTEMGDRCLMVVKQILRYAKVHDYVPANVAEGIKPSEILKQRKQVNFARLDEKELPGLLRSIEVYTGTPLARLGMRLMALTLLRTGELIDLRWSDVCLDCGDADAPKITIPGERMKAGRDHVVPLSNQAAQVLQLLQQLSGKSQYVFPGTQGAATMSNMTLLLMLKRMGYEGRMTGHGWRSVASTILNENGFNRDWIEMALAHVPQGVRHDYSKALYLDQRRGMLQSWADHLDKLAQTPAVAA
jgi:integrase